MVGIYYYCVDANEEIVYESMITIIAIIIIKKQEQQ